MTTVHINGNNLIFDELFAVALSGADPAKNVRGGVPNLIEPDDARLLETIARQWVHLGVYHGLLNSVASEHAARVMAMEQDVPALKAPGQRVVELGGLRRFGQGLACAEQLVKRNLRRDAFQGEEAELREAAAVFERHGLGCASCLAAEMETLSSVATMHDISEDGLIEDLNALLSEDEERQ